MELTRKEVAPKVLKTGFLLGTVVSCNPSNEQLAELLGYDLDPAKKEAEYSGQTKKDGTDQVTFSFWLRTEVNGKALFFNQRFMIIKKVFVSEKTGKSQFVNQTGNSGWAVEEGDLQESFRCFQKEISKGSGKYESYTTKTFRKAFQGEANLMAFMRVWLGNVDFYKESADILFDMRKAFADIDGFVKKEIQPLIDAQKAMLLEPNPTVKKDMLKDMYIRDVVALACVESGEIKDGIVPHYQKLYSEFLPGYLFPIIQSAVVSKKWDANKVVKKYIEQLKGEFGCKSAFTVSLLQDFNEEEHLSAREESFVEVEEDLNDDTY